jgi:hypothetical protein
MFSGQALMHSPQRSHFVVNSVSLGAQGGRNGFCFPVKSPRKNCKRLMEVAIKIEYIRHGNKLNFSNKAGGQKKDFAHLQKGSMPLT